MAFESLPKIAPALFSSDQDLIQVYNKKTDSIGVINPSQISSKLADGTLQTALSLRSTLQSVKDTLGNTSPLLLSTTSITNYGGGSITTNTVFGDQGLLNNSTGANNTALGYSAGSGITTGQNCIYIGNNQFVNKQRLENLKNILYKFFNKNN